MAVMKEEQELIETQRVVTIKTSGVVLPLIVIAVFAVVQLFRHGASGNDYLLLLIGSVVSAAGVVGYMITFLAFKKGQKSYVAMLLTAAGFIPYLFGSYLVFYRGLWQLKELLNGFSLGVILSSLFFIVVGWYAVKQLQELSEFGKPR